MAANGNILQVMGPVVDIKFPQGALPAINSALTVTNQFINDEADNLILEVAQHLVHRDAHLLGPRGLSFPSSETPCFASNMHCFRNLRGI